MEDLSGAELERRLGEEARRPFDLSAGPLFRAKLWRVGEKEHVVMGDAHHVASDRAGRRGLLTWGEFGALYEAYREGRESPLAELKVQYADYAAWQREQMQGEELERELGYWRERLEGARRRCWSCRRRTIREPEVPTICVAGECREEVKGGSAEGVAGVGEARGSDAVHGAAGSGAGSAGEEQREGGCGGGESDRGKESW